jgi:hypothetical protein
MRKGRTDEQIASAASWIREKTKQLGILRPDIVAIVTYFLNSEDPSTKISLERMPDYRSRKVRAEADPKTRVIYVDDETKLAFWERQPWALAIMLEEVSHIVLKHSGLRSSAKGIDQRAKNDALVSAEEAEATLLVCYIWVPIDDAYCLTDRSGLIQIFGMPPELADRYWDHIKNLQTHFGVKRHRNLPNNVVQMKDHDRRKMVRVPLAVTKPSENGLNSGAALNDNSGRGSMVSQPEIMAKSSGYLPFRCGECRQFKMRTTGNCRTCDQCGTEEGCD